MYEYTCSSCKRLVVLRYPSKRKGRNCQNCVARIGRFRREHGASLSPLYHVWASMKQRCQNPNHTAHLRYGGRGIGICAEWQKFIPFQKWATRGYKSGLQLDRIDNDNGYSPENCRWVTPAMNIRNSRVAKLTDEIVKEIRKDIASGATQRVIGKKYGVSQTCVCKIKNGQRWA